VLAGSNRGQVATLLGFVAVTAATINVVGGFLITDRMLKMFKQRLPGSGDAPKEGKALPGGNGAKPQAEAR
jgi:NAD(P) transhydrogenase subunit alpha